MTTKKTVKQHSLLDNAAKAMDSNKLSKKDAAKLVLELVAYLDLDHYNSVDFSALRAIIDREYTED